MTTSISNRRKNGLTVAALLLIVVAFTPYVGEERIIWSMWRDAPVIAAAITLAAIFLLVRSRRETH